MVKTCSTLSSLAVLALLAPAAADEPAAQTAVVKVSVLFPATLDSFNDYSVKVYLEQSQPPEPGQNPNTTIYKAVDTEQVDKVSHVKGKESRQEVTVGAKVQLDASVKYMVLGQVWANGKSKGIAMLNGKSNVLVLTGGAPNAITLTVSHLAK